MINAYSENTTSFENNGIKILHPLKAKVYKEDNGEYSLSLKDNIDNLDYYQQGIIIKVPTPWGNQCFRCNNPKINNNKIEVKASHLYYDSKNYIIADSYVVDKNCNDALDHLNSATDKTSPFLTISDIATENSYRCVRKGLDEAVNDVIDKWGGHLVRDNWKIEIRNSIGQDRGVTLAYAKNIEEIEDESNWDDVVTKLMPEGKDGQLLPELWLTSDITYDTPHTRVVKFEQDIQQSDYKDSSGKDDVTAYTNALIGDLRNQAVDYLNKNKVPKINYTIKASIQDVSDIGDTIYVKHPKVNINITTQVIAIEYDVLAKKYTSIEFGNFKNKLSDLITKVTAETEKITNEKITTTKVALKSDLEDATNRIMGVLGDSYVINEGSQILVVDKLPKEDAVNVIRINNGGIGFSKTGINGTFNSAWTIDGILDMQNINVINLVADMIKGGTLKLGTQLNQAGLIEIYDEANKLIGTLDKNGLKMFAKDNSYVLLNTEVGFAGFDKNNNKIWWVSGDEFHMKKGFIEDEITIGYKLREIPIDLDNSHGIGFVALV